MSYFDARSQESDWVHYIFILPLSLLLSLFVIFLNIYPAFATPTAVCISIFGLLGFFLAPFLFKNRKRHVFIGGDIFLILFVLCIAVFHGLTSQSLDILLWVPLLYGFVHAWTIVLNLNLRFNLLLVMSLGVSLLSILQSLSPFLKFFPAPTSLVSFGFSNTEVHGLALSLLLPIPICLLWVHTLKSQLVNFFLGAVAFFIFLAVLLTQNFTVWFNTAIAISIVLFMNRKISTLLFWLISMTIAIYSIQNLSIENHFWKELVSQQDLLSDTRRTSLQEGIKSFQTNPFVGAGWNTNSSTTPNTYFQLLSSTGFLGFALFMLFSISVLFKSLRLMQEIPRSHLWHRSFAMATLCSQLVFHSAGLFIWTLGQMELLLIYVFCVSVTLHLSYHYSRNIVPDDHCL